MVCISNLNTTLDLNMPNKSVKSVHCVKMSHKINFSSCFYAFSKDHQNPNLIWSCFLHPEYQDFKWLDMNRIAYNAMWPALILCALSKHCCLHCCLSYFCSRCCYCDCNFGYFPSFDICSSETTHVSWLMLKPI